MLRIRKYIKKPSNWPVVGIVLVMALAMLLGTATAFAVGPRPCPDAADPPASDAIVIANIVTKFAAAMGNDTTPADLNTWNPQPLPGDSGGVLWDYFPSDQASGTGVFNTYLAVQAPGNDPLHERGYNTAIKPAKCSDYDEGDSKTSALPLSAVPKVDIGGTIYREFSCDINEVSGIPDQYVSLEVLQIWQTNSTSVCGTYNMSPNYKFTPVQRLVYDLDCAKDYTLILDYGVNTGSGKPDYKVFVPNEWFDQTLLYVVMVVDHGNLEYSTTPPSKKDPPSPWLGYGCSDGFEEWGVRVVEPTCCLDITKGSINACYPTQAAAEAAALAATTVTDDCSATAPSVSVSTVGTCSAVITVTATDSCDNSLNVTYNTRIDSTPPELGNLPNGGDLGCNPTLPVCDPNVTANDNCDGNITADVVCTPGQITNVGTCGKQQIFNYFVEDECGNNDTADVTYTWKEDTTDPELGNLPSGGDLGCSNPPTCDPAVNATDACDGPVPVNCIAGPITGSACNWTQTFTYWAVDLCGNNASANVTYTWKEPECCVTCNTACAANGTAGQVRFPGASNWFTYITYNRGEGTNSTPKEYPIFASQTHLIGTLYVYNTGNTLFVKYSTTGAEPGCEGYFSAYHLQVDCSYSALANAIVRRRNPVPGMCEYNGSSNYDPETGWIEADIGGCGSTIWIFAHSVACYYCAP